MDYSTIIDYCYSSGHWAGDENLLMTQVVADDTFLYMRGVLHSESMCRYVKISSSLLSPGFLET